MKTKSKLATLVAALALSSSVAISQLHADPAATGAGGSVATPVGPGPAASGLQTQQSSVSTGNPGNAPATPQGTTQNPISPTLIPPPSVTAPGNQSGSGNATANQQGTGNAAAPQAGSGNTAAPQAGSGNTATNQAGSGNTSANQPGSGNTPMAQPGSGNQAPH